MLESNLNLKGATLLSRSELKKINGGNAALQGACTAYAMNIADRFMLTQEALDFAAMGMTDQEIWDLAYYPTQSDCVLGV